MRPQGISDSCQLLRTKRLRAVTTNHAPYAMSNEIVLQLNPSPTNARNSEATFVTLKNGRILLAWSKFIGDNHSDFGRGVIAARWSDDGGRTWSTGERVLVRREGATNVMSPSLLRLQDGRIALLYLRKESSRVCVPYIRFSRDEAETFSKPVCVMPEPGYYVVNNDRMIQLSSGRIVIPSSLCRHRLPSPRTRHLALPGDTHTRVPKAMETFMACPSLIFFHLSDDDGRTWMESENNFYRCQPDGTGLEEPGVVEMPNGKLWSYARTGIIGIENRNTRQWSSFSGDGGVVWSEPEPSRFISPCSPMHVKRIPGTRDLLAVWNDHSGRFKVPRPKPISWGRTPLVSAISRDCGKTWKHHKLVEKSADRGFCYPAIHFAEDAALLSYNAGGAHSRDPLDTQRVRRISLRELHG